MDIIYFGLLIFFLSAASVTFVFFKGLHKITTSLNHTYRVARLPRSVAKSLDEARHYARKISQATAQCPPGPVKDHLDRLTGPSVEQSLQNLALLEESLINLYTDHNLNRETRRAEAELQRLQRQMLAASGEEVKLLRRLVESKKKQLKPLSELQKFRQQSEWEIRKISTDLAAAHAETLLIVTRGDLHGQRLHNLDENLQEHLTSLRDMVSTMEELNYSQVAT